MMPGENQSEVGGIAFEATTGTCQNCTVLNQSLDEYVAAFLTLKQKIVDTDHLLNEYKDKCDELQKSQRESSKLHRQLDEVLLKLEPLEKQTVEFEQMKSRLEENKTELQLYRKRCEDVERLQAENVQTCVLKEKLKETLRQAEDTIQKHKLENEKLRTETKSLEEELQKTQESFRANLQTAEEHEALKMENAKTLILKGNLENELLVIKGSKHQQDKEIGLLKSEKRRLQETLHTTQQRLEKLEGEFRKEKRSMSSQTNALPLLDKGKVRMLLEELWDCVERSSQIPENLFSSGEDATPMKTQFHAGNGTHSRSSIALMANSLPTDRGAKTSPIESKCITSPAGRSPNALAPENRSVTAPVISRSITSPKNNSPKASIEDSKPETLPAEISSKAALIDCRSIMSPAYSGPKASLSDAGCETVPGDSNPEISPTVSKHKPSPQKLEKKDTLQFKTQSRKRKFSSENLEKMETLTDANTTLPNKMTSRDVQSGDEFVDMQDIKEWLKPLPDVLSPVPSPTIELAKMDVDKPISGSEKDFSSTSEPDGQSLHEDLLSNNTKFLSNIKNQEFQKEEGDETSVLYCDNMQAIAAESGDCLDPQNTSDPQMEVEEIICEADVDQTAKPIEGNYSKRDLENKPSQTVEELQECLDKEETHAEDANLNDNSIENSVLQYDSESELVLGNFVESPECKIPDQSLTSTIDVMNCSKLDIIEHNESISPENNSLEDSATHNSLDRLDDKAKVTCTTSMVTECVDEIRNGSLSSLKPSGEESVPPSEDEVFSGIDKELGNISVVVQNSTAETPQKDDSQKVLSDRSLSPNTGLTLVVEDGEDATERDSNNQKLSVQTNEVNKDKEPFRCEPTAPSIKPFQQPDERSANLQSPAVSGLDSPEETSLKSTSPCTPDLDRRAADLQVSALNSKIMNPQVSLSLIKVRSEMGSPLRPLVMPLTATPPRFEKAVNPPTKAILSTPGSETVPSDNSATGSQPGKTTPCAPSSPLQFGSATPKHAVPVPGRLPSSAPLASPLASPETSMQMLDTMYPKLSAQARTLNILRGNVNLNRAGNENGSSPPSANQIAGIKSISSSSTAFTKTEQKPTRIGVNMILPKSAKRLRLDNCSAVSSGDFSPKEQVKENFSKEDASEEGRSNPKEIDIQLEVEKSDLNHQISEALSKLSVGCFDVMPVVKSHIFVGRISQVPILTDGEKTVIAEFCGNQAYAEKLMFAILTKLKTERSVLNCNYLQALCRVYTGICRRFGDYQKAHAFAYNVLKEDFLDASKLILFMITTWPSVLFHESSLCKAIQTVTKLKSDDELLNCFMKYLNWDKSPPEEILKLINSTLKALKEDKDLIFQKHDRHGHNLCPAAWEYIYTLDLLCTHMKWKWTHDYVIGKELWPIMNTWVMQPRLQQSPVPDVTVAAVLRLIGRLGQLGMKQMLCKSVQNVAKAINLFGKHGITEGVPQEVQLSAVYAIYDLSPCNPKDALEALASWRSETTQLVPSTVTSCITQIGSLCRLIKS